MDFSATSAVYLTWEELGGHPLKLITCLIQTIQRAIERVGMERETAAINKEKINPIRIANLLF